MFALSAADSEEGGSFLVSPDLGLVLWTVIVLALFALVLYVLVRLAIHLQREARKR